MDKVVESVFQFVFWFCLVLYLSFPRILGCLTFLFSILICWDYFCFFELFYILALSVIILVLGGVIFFVEEAQSSFLFIEGELGLMFSSKFGRYRKVGRFGRRKIFRKLARSSFTTFFPIRLFFVYLIRECLFRFFRVGSFIAYRMGLVPGRVGYALTKRYRRMPGVAFIFLRLLVGGFLEWGMIFFWTFLILICLGLLNYVLYVPDIPLVLIPVNPTEDLELELTMVPPLDTSRFF